MRRWARPGERRADHDPGEKGGLGRASLKGKAALPYSPAMGRMGDSGGGIARDGADRRDRHVVATGLGLFAAFVALAAWAFPAVRDLTLFESVYLWVCSPFIG